MFTDLFKVKIIDHSNTNITTLVKISFIHERGESKFINIPEYGNTIIAGMLDLA